MDSVELVCFLTTRTFAVHNIFVMIGIGLPLIFTIAMIFTIIKKRHGWAFIMVILQMGFSFLFMVQVNYYIFYILTYV
ncbi:hypothetical protein ASS86_11280 [Staphylococcus saprophyticus]|jgi:cytochrome bd-type quinol oxidase subunit 1|nr:hypothetical protein A4A82_12340 [Staphylococcus cohnii]OEK35232.1 hypothetical protein ASS86_11280 [Staphylococcus saprophyticus]OEK39224.1 hypothetical protein ASS89_09450 [Staphylococcus saprophyticus]OIX93572.1 hypothetical protein BFN02_10795 [Staphylococcus equorum]